MKFLKFFAIGLGAVALLLVIVAAGALFYISNADHRTLVQDLAKKNGGWRVQFETLNLSVFPRFTFDATGVKVLPHQGTANVFEAQSIQVDAPLLPLLFSQQVSKIDVERPVIKLVRTADGKANWEPVRRSRRSSSNAGTFDPGLLMKLQNVNVTKGHFELRDETIQQNVVVQNINVALANETNVVKRGTFNAVLNGMPVDVLARLRLEEGTSSAIPTDIRFTLEDNQIKFEGTLIDAFAATPSLAGGLDVSAPSALALLHKLKLAELDPTLRNESIGLKATINASAAVTTLEDAQFSLGENTLLGDITVKPQGKGYNANVDLRATMLNLSNYSFCQAQPAQQGKKQAQPATPWSDQMVDLSALHPHQLAILVDLAQVQCIGKTFERIKLDLQTADKKLNLNELRLDMAPGSSIRESGSMGLEQPLAGRFETTLTNVDPAWFTPALAGKLNVPFNGDIKLAFNGSSVAEWVSNLNGEIVLKADEGKVMGFSATNLVSTLKDLANAKLPTGNVQDVQSIELNYKVDQGIMRAETVKLQSTGINATAEGKIDLANWTINHKVIATSDMVNLPPILIRGSLNKPTVVPELTSVEAISTGVGAVLGGPVGAAVGNMVAGKLGELGIARASSPTSPTSPTESGANPGGLPFDIMDKENLQKNLRNFLRPE